MSPFKLNFLCLRKPGIIHTFSAHFKMFALCDVCSSHIFMRREQRFPKVASQRRPMLCENVSDWTAVLWSEMWSFSCSSLTPVEYMKHMRRGAHVLIWRISNQSRYDLTTADICSTPPGTWLVFLRLWDWYAFPPFILSHKHSSI